MSNDAINNWVEKAKNVALETVNPSSGVQVIKRLQPQTRGNMIMDIAEKIRPFLINMFDGVRDENGMLLQPARIRGIALNVAQGIAREQENRG